MSNRANPPALEPYLRLPPEASLVLLTSTLSCSINWLTCRFISTALFSKQAEDLGDEAHPVVLVSWLRNLQFWTSEIRRTTGIDVSRHPKAFTFIDALSDPNLSLETLSLPDGPLLILDTPFPALPQTVILSLRAKSYATILTYPADIASGSPPTPLELSAASFLTTQAHAARFVMSARELETGAAKDVSGILRITRGGDCDVDDEVVEKELLYLVQRDGGVKVFHRGEE